MMKLFRLVMVIAVLVCLAPMISPFAAGGIASHYGCRLDEGSIHPCVIGGVDRGDTLYTMFVLGWVMLATLPVGAGLLALWLAVELVRFVMLRRQRLHDGPQ